MNTAKEEVRRLLDELPEDVSLEEIQYRISVRQKIARGLEDVRQGRTVSQSDAEQRMGRWLALRLALATACVIGASCSPGPGSVSRDELPGFPGFPIIPPIANADPATRHETEFLVPTRLRVTRSENRIAVEADPDSLESITLEVGANMVTGFRREFAVYRDGQLLDSNRYGLGGTWYMGTSFYNTSLDGIPQMGETYEIEARLQIFETDTPPQHIWSPESPKYRVLWSRTITERT